ncbi:MAG: glycosyltransferase family 4 protein [Chloroflexota bacterium]|nr:glycosyltransferase family 4 protein [Chloroflexota bacterium]
MRVAINGLFLRQPFSGTGQYTRHLLEQLSEVDGLELDVRQPKAAGNLAKLWWEQVLWPAQVGSAADLLHCPYFALPLRRRLPAVVTIHDLIPVLLPAYGGSPLVRAYTRLQMLACRSAEAIIVDSDCSKRDVVRVLKAPESRVRVIYLGVDPSFVPDASGPSPLERPYVLYLGGLDRRKNVGAALAAFRAIAPSFPNLVLTIVGEPRSGSSRFPDLRPLAAPLGDRVRFLGWVSEEQKLRLYQHAELFVYPSLYEGFGLDPLEAMACGCPVVCSDASSLPEVVGDAALLAPVGDPSALAEAMRQALEDPEPLRRRGPEQAAKFTWRRCADETVQVYRSVLER